MGGDTGGNVKNFLRLIHYRHSMRCNPAHISKEKVVGRVKHLMNVSFSELQPSLLYKVYVGDLSAGRNLWEWYFLKDWVTGQMLPSNSLLVMTGKLYLLRKYPVQDKSLDALVSSCWAFISQDNTYSICPAVEDTEQLRLSHDIKIESLRLGRQLKMSSRVLMPSRGFNHIMRCLGHAFFSRWLSSLLTAWQRYVGLEIRFTLPCVS